jgi:hypothetical protein
MKNTYFRIFLLLFSIIATAQQAKDSTSRRGKLFLTVGTEYRITPIYSLEAEFSQQAFGTWIDAQNSGAAINYGFDYFVTKNLSLNFGHSMRYGYLTSDVNIAAPRSGITGAKSTIISDYHFYADYHLKIFREGELFIRLGKSFSNRGTGATRTRVFVDESGNEPDLVFRSTINYSYQPWNFALGYKKNGLSLTGGVYTSAVTNYFDDGSSFTVPYVSLKYDLFRF